MSSCICKSWTIRYTKNKQSFGTFDGLSRNELQLKKKGAENAGKLCTFLRCRNE